MTCVDQAAYMRPKPEAVARLVASHGLEAAAARWHWMDERTLCAIARTGRAVMGEAPRARRARSYTDEDAAVAVEASYVLGSTTRGERAAGIYDNGGRSCFDMRGLDYVRVSAEERGRAARIGHAANRGDAAAIAERDAMHAHEAAVGRVIRAALRLVPEQPTTGRYVLPPVGDALRAALAGEDPTAVAAVFPGLGLTVAPESPPVAPAPEAAPVTLLSPTSEIVLPAAPEASAPQPTEGSAAPVLTVRARGRMPDVETLRLDHAGDQPASMLAARYGVTVNAVYQAWQRLGLPAGGRPRKPKEVQVSAAAPAADRGTELVVYVDLPPGRLPLADLSLAVTLARDTGLSRDEAIAWVRADVAAAGRS